LGAVASRSRVPFIVAVIATVAVVAACGSSKHNAAPSTTTQPASTAAPTSSAPPTTRRAGTPTTSADDWTTYYHDAARSGEAGSGPSSPANVHQLWASAQLDGAIYAQPLILGNRVIIATENNTVYALNRTSGKTLWSRHLGDPVPNSSLPCGDVDPVGVTGTPVIDVATQRLYVVGMVMPAKHTLFALDLSSGKVIASTDVDAPGADPKVHNQRGALALSGNNIFVPFGGRYGDCGDYHGRVVSVALTAPGFGAVASYTLPTQRQGGFWAPPGPVIGTDGSLYLASGNSSSSGQFDYGNSVVRLHPNLTLADSFAPANWAALNASDTDLGSTNPALLPNGTVFQIGKGGTGYLLDAAHLGGIGGQLHSATVCNGESFGGVPRRGTTLFVPCTSGITEVTVHANSFDIGWSASVSTPGPPIITGNTVWSIVTGAGELVALDASTGRTLTSQHIGTEPSRFVSAAAASGDVFAPAGRVLYAFGD
jgi:outer membrane protein assembly factor BamB